jgi:subtilisin family serine protease
VDHTQKRSAFSQQNDSVFVVAPGENYRSTIGTEGYEGKSGTSQATPIVAGAAAVLLSAKKDMTVDEFKDYIISCSEPLEDEYCGYGLLNIEAMFKECIRNTDYYVSPINDDGVIVNPDGTTCKPEVRLAEGSVAFTDTEPVEDMPVV